MKPDVDQLVAFMRSVKHLTEAEDQMLREAAALAEWLVLPSRQVLMTQGQPHSTVYLVYSGKLRFEVRSDAGDVTAVGDLTPGDILGEIGLLHGERAIATVHAVRNTHLMALDGAAFRMLLAKSPAVLFSITRKMIERVDSSLVTRREGPRSESIAVIPLDDGIPVADFVQSLAGALASYGTTTCITKQRLEAELGSGRADLALGDPDFAANLDWLSRYAREHQYLLLTADAGATPWSLECVREADRVLLVGRAGGEPRPTPLERRLAAELDALSPRFELVLLHEAGQRPAATAAFLAERRVARHHHVRLAAPGDAARLARLLTGRAVGLALGGGGIRAAAHIGLLRAFQEAGIPVDQVGGTSIGALIGALFATGFGTDDMERVIRESVVGDNLFGDYGPPVVSVARGRKFSRFLQALLGEQLIEDMPRDYFATATNLTTGALEILDRGSAWTAVRASASVPAILPPVERGGHLYVDGGLLDNVPGEPLRARGAGRIVAVDVSAAVRVAADAELGALIDAPGTGPSLGRLVRNRFSKERRAYPRIGDLVVRSMVIGSRDRARRIQQTADLYVRMPVDEWKMLDFAATSTLVEVGYRHAMEHIGAWKERLGAL